VVNVDKNAADLPACQALPDAGELPPECELRPVKYRNKIVAHDHRFMKRRVKPGWGLAGYRTAWAPLPGDAALNQLRQGQGAGTSKDDMVRQVRFIDRACGGAA